MPNRVVLCGLGLKPACARATITREGRTSASQTSSFLSAMAHERAGHARGGKCGSRTIRVTAAMGWGRSVSWRRRPRMPSACSGGGGLGIHSGRWHLGVAALVGAQHGVDDREPEDTGDEDHAEQDHGALAEGGLGGRSCLRRGLVAALGDGQLRRVDARRTACPHSRS